MDERIDERIDDVLAVNIGERRLDACLVQVCIGPSWQHPYWTLKELECHGEETGSRNWVVAATREIRTRSFQGYPIWRNNQPVSRDPHEALVSDVEQRCTTEDPRGLGGVGWSEATTNGRAHIVILEELLIDRLRELFGRYLAPTLALIRDTVENHDGKITLAFSGEGFNNWYIKDAIVRFVDGLQETLHLRAPVPYKLYRRIPEDLYSGSGVTAAGAIIAIAASKGTTLTSMMAGGAVFGLEYYNDEPFNGEEGFEPKEPLFGPGVPSDATFTYPRQGRPWRSAGMFAIVCDPFGATANFGSPGWSCWYNIFDVPNEDTKLRGRYTCSLKGCQLEDSGADFLRLQIDYCSIDVEPEVKTRKIYRLPLKPRMGSCRMHVDMANVTTRSEFLS